MLIWRSQKTSKTNEFVKNNDPSSIVGYPGDNWRKFLKNNGGSGETFHDLEKSYLQSQGFSTWDKFLESLGYIVGVIRDRIRSFLSSILSLGTSSYLQEDGLSKYQLEDGTGNYILE